MALISLQNITIAFGSPNVLNNLNLQIEKGQRICLLGRNGTGKTTLMKIIHGEISPDNGTVQKEQGIKISYFSQEIPDKLNGTVFEIIVRHSGLNEDLLLKLYNGDKNSIDLHRQNGDLENDDVWSSIKEIEKILSIMSLNSEWTYNTLSGGMKRRVLLASALVSEPDLLLLDEPTNHLDIETITLMEDFLLRLNVTLLFVTHDRALLKKLATRIIELDRGELVDWLCNYETFLKRKQGVLNAEEKNWGKFDKKLAREEIWIRQGIKARRTRNEGRVRALLKMREERQKRRQREGAVSMNISNSQRSGKIVIETDNISFGYESKPLINNFSAIIARGDKIGIIGPNGCGKTTLINLLLGKLTPLSGAVKHGINVSVAYYDQLREQLDEKKTVWENVLPNSDTVNVNGKDKHIISYLQDFLFTPERVKTPVCNLSGGERNRLCLARLFTQSINLLVLDEPTNDLDAETLELLEELLVNFKGAVLLISHDRTFLNNIVTGTIVFSEDGTIEEYVGGYDDWLRQKKSIDTAAEKRKRVDKKNLYKEEKKARQKKKLSFIEVRELQSLPIKIESMEKELEELHTTMANPDLYRDKDDVLSAKNRLAELGVELPNVYKRWEYLESIE